MVNKCKYGWQPDLPDFRDKLYSAPASVIPLPEVVDLRDKMPVIYDQGQLSSCTANALAAAFEFEELAQGKEDFMPSRLFIYYNERVIEDTVLYDAGARIRDGIKSIAKDGVCDELLWEYARSNLTVMPSKECYDAAHNHRAFYYERLTQNLNQLKTCLADGFPFTFGFSVYEEFESAEVAKTGTVPFPDDNSQPVGGHAVLACGYDNSKEAFLIRNSWGKSWGLDGYFYLPYNYVTDVNLSDDFWVIKGV